MKCLIFRCSKKDEMYLYVPFNDDHEAAVKDLPPELLKLTGQLEVVMSLELSLQRKLARADVGDVMASLREKGFFLQMPPDSLLRTDESMLNDPSDGF